MNELRNLLPKEFPSGLRVLLVEDDENSIQVIDQMLKSWHYQGIYSKSWIIYKLSHIFML